MKKQILGLALAAMMFGAVATGCSSAKKTDSSDSSAMTKDTIKMTDTSKKMMDTGKMDTTKKDTTKKM